MRPGAFFRQEAAIMCYSYGGLLFDLAVVPLLLWQRTRLATFVVAVIFHLCNALLFQFSIGIFPWVMIAATLMFFDPPPGPECSSFAISRPARKICDGRRHAGSRCDKSSCWLF